MNDRAFQHLERLLAHHYRMVLNLQEKYRAETGRDFCPAGIGKYELPEYCRGCDVYTPADAPEISVYFQVDPDDGPEVHGILVHGQEISDFTYDLLADMAWEEEIVKMLEKQEDDLIGDY